MHFKSLLMKNMFLLPLAILCTLTFSAQSAYEIIEKADSKLRGLSSYTEMTITTVRPKWEKRMTLKGWSKGADFSVSLVLSPAKEKGSVFLKRKNEVWNYIPSLERTIKLPPSMMMQNWMGTDLTNDDLVKQSSTVVDYTHKIAGTESIEGLPCWKLILIPKEEATVVWGKVIVWVDKADHMQLKSEFYDEDDELINVMLGSNVKTFSGKKLPAKIEFIPVEEEGHKTILEYNVWDFDINVSEDKFNQNKMSQLK